MFTNLWGTCPAGMAGPEGSGCSSAASFSNISTSSLHGCSRQTSLSDRLPVPGISSTSSSSARLGPALGPISALGSTAGGPLGPVALIGGSGPQEALGSTAGGPLGPVALIGGSGPQEALGSTAGGPLGPVALIGGSGPQEALGSTAGGPLGPCSDRGFRASWDRRWASDLGFRAAGGPGIHWIGGSVQRPDWRNSVQTQSRWSGDSLTGQCPSWTLVWTALWDRWRHVSVRENIIISRSHILTWHNIFRSKPSTMIKQSNLLNLMSWIWHTIEKLLYFFCPTKQEPHHSRAPTEARCGIWTTWNYFALTIIPGKTGFNLTMHF